MGQLMGALNNSTLLDDLNINIESLHGGFDCNVEEVRFIPDFPLLHVYEKLTRQFLRIPKISL